MSLSKAIRTAYDSALSGNLSLNGQVLPVFDAMALPEVQPPYVILSSQTAVQRPVKGCKIYRATMLIDIVTKSMNRSDAETVESQIEPLIETQELTVNGYQLADTNRGSDTDLVSKAETGYITRKLIRYEHNLTKL